MVKTIWPLARDSAYARLAICSTLKNSTFICTKGLFVALHDIHCSAGGTSIRINHPCRS